ncbi:MULTISPECIES: hypothetical protein [unclassified Chryseobacterium]|uniref:hypothetical protein n=1 Tax=unclassified Chryseobacterium TaxID=2593645 RepID=UPI00100AF5E4|nr:MULTISPECIES: hypothetical protein [unclassified Chryseobacterium]RXM50091.1 hypothetical protein BOQ64_20010 [Chryseobacterium sp. CH25]RXM66951.1 hypothetical protein BOQ60_03200 [Chryseobacterium sp. CH1]
MNKKFLLIVAATLVMSQYSKAQLRTNGFASGNISGESAFMDASGATNGFSDDANTKNGKGLVFPRTNLTNFTFASSSGDEDNFPTAYDGMIVYNTGTGNTPATGSGIGTQAVTPGFYYFSNPTAGPSSGNFSPTTGRWVAIGASPKVTIGTAETTTNTIVNVSPGVDKQVYAIKGTFSANGTSTAVNIPAPTGMTTMYAITIYKSGSGVVYDRSLYSYNVVTTAGNAITGSPSMSVVYPNGTYDYVLEYLK